MKRKEAGESPLDCGTVKPDILERGVKVDSLGQETVGYLMVSRMA
jgi:hypothetical protein